MKKLFNLLKTSGGFGAIEGMISIGILAGASVAYMSFDKNVKSNSNNNKQKENSLTLASSLVRLLESEETCMVVLNDLNGKEPSLDGEMEVETLYLGSREITRAPETESNSPNSIRGRAVYNGVNSNSASSSVASVGQSNSSEESSHEYGNFSFKSFNVDIADYSSINDRDLILATLNLKLETSSKAMVQKDLSVPIDLVLNLDEGKIIGCSGGGESLAAYCEISLRGNWKMVDSDEGRVGRCFGATLYGAKISSNSNGDDSINKPIELDVKNLKDIVLVDSDGNEQDLRRETANVVTAEGGSYELEYLSFHEKGNFIQDTGFLADGADGANGSAGIDGLDASAGSGSRAGTSRVMEVTIERSPGSIEDVMSSRARGRSR